MLDIICEQLKSQAAVSSKVYNDVKVTRDTFMRIFIIFYSLKVYQSRLDDIDKVNLCIATPTKLEKKLSKTFYCFLFFF